MRATAAFLTILLMTTTLNAQNKKALWALTAGAQAATIFDMETTVRALNRCPTCSEGNPAMRPFMGTRASAYAAGTALNSVAFYAPYKMKESGNKWWWVPLVAQIGVHTFLGIKNSRIDR
jgi:hypothetical protein